MVRITEFNSTEYYLLLFFYVIFGYPATKRSYSRLATRDSCNDILTKMKAAILAFHCESSVASTILFIYVY